MFTINELKITQKDFVDFAKNRKDKPNYELFNEFKDKTILTYYKDNLEKSEPQFASTLQEHKDGLLLFELMQQKIWNKSAQDSLGLKNYFDKNIGNYKTKNLKEINGEVMNDYQNFLEKNWIADLRKNAIITVDKKQLKKIKKHYNRK